MAFEIDIANTLAEAIATAEARATQSEKHGIRLVIEEIETFLDDRDNAALTLAINEAHRQAQS